MSPATVVSPLKAPSAMGVECRVRERHACGLKTSCQPIAARGDKDMLWPAILRDLSVLGVGLVLGRRFERGAGLAIEIPETESQPGDTLLAKVTHTTALPEGRWLLGCAFVSELSEEELTRLLELARAQNAPAQPEAAATQEDGLAAANENPSRAVLIPGINFEGTSNFGRVAQVPIRRLYLSGSWPVPPGTVLKIKVANPPHNLPGVKIKVNSCALRDGRWTLNYTFVERPSADLMGLFGYTLSLMEL
jgi:hypothetical protein